MAGWTGRCCLFTAPEGNSGYREKHKKERPAGVSLSGRTRGRHRGADEELRGARIVPRKRSVKQVRRHKEAGVRFRRLRSLCHKNRRNNYYGGPMVSRTYGTHKKKLHFPPIFSDNIWSYFSMAPRDKRPRKRLLRDKPTDKPTAKHTHNN